MFQFLACTRLVRLAWVQLLDLFVVVYFLLSLHLGARVKDQTQTQSLFFFHVKGFYFNQAVLV